jgi:hypothetical protein
MKIFLALLLITSACWAADLAPAPVSLSGSAVGASSSAASIVNRSAALKDPTAPIKMEWPPLTKNEVNAKHGYVASPYLNWVPDPKPKRPLPFSQANRGY